MYKPLKSVTHGQCDTRPTFPAIGHHRRLTGTNLYCLVTEAHVCEQLAWGCYLKRNARESNHQPLSHKSYVLTITPPCHIVIMIFVAAVPWPAEMYAAVLITLTNCCLLVEYFTPSPQFLAHVYYSFCDFVRTLHNAQSLLVCLSSSFSILCILFLEKKYRTQSVPLCTVAPHSADSWSRSCELVVF